MMQQGLGALTPQLPAGQAPANPTRLAAAMDVVTSDAEEQILDPRTLALIKYKDAVQAMQSADQLMAASRPAPTPPTVAERTKLAAEQGIMGLASRLAPGVQQQGNRMGAAQMQQAMTGGLPQLPSPNMARMAGGGIVGYADGGGVDTDVQRYIEQYRTIMAAIQSAGTPEQKAVLQQRLREIQSTFDPDVISRAHMQMSGQGMADGGRVKKFQPGGAVEYDEQGNPIVAAEPSYQDLLTAGQRRALESGIAAMEADPDAQARAAATRLQELAGLESLMDERKIAQQKFRELQESQFSPEKERSRLLRAALASGAERGLGGFGAGYAAEEGRIAQERQTAQQNVVADMDKLIDNLRTMGLSQFEAEQAARQQVETGRNQGMSTVQALAEANQRAQENLQNVESDRQQRENALTVAEMQMGEFARTLRVLTNKYMREGLPQGEAEARALDDINKQEVLLEILSRRTPIDPRMQAAFEQAVALVGQEVSGVAESAEDKLKKINEVLPSVYLQMFGEPMPTDSGSVQTERVGLPPEAAINLLRSNPSLSNIAQFNEIFGPGAAERALAQ